MCHNNLSFKAQINKMSENTVFEGNLKNMTEWDSQYVSTLFDKNIWEAIMYWISTVLVSYAQWLVRS